jgi:hypothetical protein
MALAFIAVSWWLCLLTMVSSPSKSRASGTIVTGTGILHDLRTLPVRAGDVVPQTADEIGIGGVFAEVTSVEPLSREARPLTDPHAAMEATLAGLDPAERSAILAAVAGIGSRAQLALVAGHLASGDVTRARIALRLNPDILGPVDRATAAAYAAGFIARGTLSERREPCQRRPAGPLAIQLIGAVTRRAAAAPTGCMSTTKGFGVRSSIAPEATSALHQAGVLTTFDRAALAAYGRSSG